MILLSENSFTDPMTAVDAANYAETVKAKMNIPVFGDRDETAVDALPWNGRPVTKCVLLPDRTIAKCLTGHGDDEELKEFIREHYAQTNLSDVQ